MQSLAVSLNPRLPPKDLIRVSLPDSHWRGDMSVCPGPWTACFTWGLEMFPAQVALVLKVCQFSEFYCDIETRRTRGIFVLETRAQMSRENLGFYFSYAAEVNNITVCAMLFPFQCYKRRPLVYLNVDTVEITWRRMNFKYPTSISE